MNVWAITVATRYPLYSMTQGPSMGSVFVSTINFHSFVKILTISILKKKKKSLQ